MVRAELIQKNRVVTKTCNGFLRSHVKVKITCGYTLTISGFLVIIKVAPLCQGQISNMCKNEVYHLKLSLMSAKISHSTAF